MKRFLYHILLLLTLLFIIFPALAQDQTDQESDAYTKVITARAEKIVKALDISDSDKFVRVRDMIAGQYRKLSAIHDTCDARIDYIKSGKELSNEKNERIAKIKSKTARRLKKLHKAYLAKLSRELTDSQIDKVKDGMTYGVLRLTYNGYVDMIPALTDGQKKQIMAYLVEAREHAMDAGSSEEKHGWFGKYKGKINNFLSAAGYDLRKEGKEWEKRREAAKSK